MTAQTLLPPNRTPWETALSLTSAERRPLPVELITATWNADTCPADLLSYLAWGLSVDVWDDTWPETKKREACRKALLMHRLKTTLAGVKEHVAMTGATVRRAIRPPARGFLRGAMTDAQRQAWFDTLAQIRIYPFYHRAIAVRRHFMSGPGGRQFHSSQNYGTQPLTDDSGNALTDDAGNPLTVFSLVAGEDRGTPAGDAVRFRTGFLRRSRGTDLYGRRATFYDHGVEMDATYETNLTAGFERVYLPRTSHASHFGHSFHGGGFASATHGPEDVVTVSLDDFSSLFAVERSQAAVDVRSKRVAQGRIAPESRSFCGRFGKGRFLRTSFAPLMIYDRVYLHDAARLGARRSVREYHGHGRFGIDAYKAELRIEVPMLRSPRRSGRWHKVGFQSAANLAPMWQAIEAVRVSKAFRDTVTVDTAVHGVVTFNGGLKFGEFTFGEVKRVV